MSNEINTFGGSQIGGNVDSGGDFVGRDKIILNIVTVGQFLEFAGIQNLLPSLSGQLPFNDVRDAIENVFDGNHNDLTEAIAFAGEMLRDILSDWVSANTGIRISLRPLIVGLDKELYKKLKLSGYWDIYREIESDWNYVKAEVLNLESTSTLWEEEFSVHKYFTLTYTCSKARRHRDEQDEETVSFTQLFVPFDQEVESWSTREQRIFLVGIVLDLIRIHSESTLNIQFLRSLVNSLDVSSIKVQKAAADDIDF